MRKPILFQILIYLFILFSFSCDKKNPTKNDNSTAVPNTVTDIDGNIYHTVKIGDQIWTAENLKVTKYRNGDSIPNVQDSTEWGNLTTGAQCAYDNDEVNVEIYGRLYNWYALNDSRGIAPAGWHVPSDEEWKALEMFLGMSQSEADNTGYRGTNEGSKLAGEADLWSNGGLENNAAFGESGLSALPAGYRGNYDGYFHFLGRDAYFWSATEKGSYLAWLRYLNYGYSEVYRTNYNKLDGFSIRLIRD
jgi:uncharacterized protein (TIGR02145 family)